MLEHIFGSKTRTRLLRLFLMHPEDSYFIRELTRKIDTQINSVRRELKNLIDCGIISEAVIKSNHSLKPQFVVKKEPQSKKQDTELTDKHIKRYFTANKEYSLYQELRSLFLKSPILFQQDLIREVQNLGSINSIILSGFFVNREDTPVDLLIIGDVSRSRLLKVVQAFEREYEREINFTTMTRDEYAYRKSVTDRFLFKILEGKKIVVFDTLTDQQV
ncbi:MAG: hypothetical protein AAB400_03280 [Patescibacteria group bacterium]